MSRSMKTAVIYGDSISTTEYGSTKEVIKNPKGERAEAFLNGNQD